MVGPFFATSYRIRMGIHEIVNAVQDSAIYLDSNLEEITTTRRLQAILDCTVFF